MLKLKIQCISIVSLLATTPLMAMDSDLREERNTSPVSPKEQFRDAKSTAGAQTQPPAEEKFIPDEEEFVILKFTPAQGDDYAMVDPRPFVEMVTCGNTML
jgi:hypothetical protein